MSASSRYFNTKFWRDNYVDNLDPSEKLLFIYLFTNPEATTTGIYEMPLRMMSSDTGFDKTMLQKLFDRLETDKKAFFRNGWVCTPNTIRHQNIKNKFIKKGIENGLKEISEDIIEEFYQLGDKKFKETIEEYYYLNNGVSPETSEPIVPQEKKEPLKKPPVEPKKLKEEQKPKEVKHKYGEYKHVLLTDDQKEKLKEKFGNKKAQDLVKELDEGIELKGYKYKNHYLAILKWAKKPSFPNVPNSGSVGTYNPRGNDALRRQEKEAQYRDEIRERNQNSAANERLRKLREQSQLLANNKTV